MIQLNIRYFVLFLFFLILSCDKKEICDNNINIIEECLNNDIIIQRISNINYIVYPYFTEFGLNKDFIKTLNKKETMRYQESFLKEIGYSKNSFKKLKKEIDEKYFKKECDKLNKLSTTDSSRTVIYFSGISRDLFFVDVYNFIKPSSLREILKYDSNKNDISNYASYVIMLNDEGHIKEVKPILLSAGL